MKIRKPAHSIEISEEAGVRYLHFGSDWIQGAMRLRKPDALELEYTREMLTCLLWRDWAEWPRAVLLIGLGAGSLVKFIHARIPAARLHVVEIDRRVPLFAHAHFAVPADPGRIDITVGDGSLHVRDSTERYDLILVDGFDHRARAGALDTPAFYNDCRARLESGGIMATNLFGNNRRFDASLRKIDAAYGGNMIVLPAGEMGNVIAFGLESDGSDLALADLRERARLLHSETGLNLRPTLKRMVITGMMPTGSLRV